MIFVFNEFCLLEFIEIYVIEYLICNIKKNEGKIEKMVGF